MKPYARASLVAAAALALWGCHFAIPGLIVQLDDGGVTDAAGDLADAGGDDLAGLCTAGGPTSGCSADGTTLILCSGATQQPMACADGCVATPMPHCASLDPSGAVDPMDYLDKGLLLDVEITGMATVNGDTGEISAQPLNRGAVVGVDQNILYRRVAQASGPELAVFGFRSLHIISTAHVAVIGTRPVAFVALNDLVVDGEIDAQGPCMPGMPVAGGGPGAAPKNGAGNPGGGSGAGQGGGSAAMNGGGGGGGGHGDSGGAGAGGGLSGGAGMLFGDYTVDNPAFIGGGGGGSGGGSGMNQGGRGGSGGGFVMFASNQMLTLGATAVLNAGGCHGSAPSSNGGGGGGGAGGGLVFEARTITLSSGSTIVANGGGGGGGDNGSNGGDGPDDTDRAKGGGGGGNGSNGGDGGHTGNLLGDPGVPLNGGEKFGGGGGGGVGRIAFKTKTGALTTTGVVMSPKVGETSPGHAAPATIGVAKFR